MDITIDKTFSPTWEVRLVKDPSPNLVEYCYPGAIKGGIVDGVFVEICPSTGDHWLASFSAGNKSPNAPSAVISMPNRDDIMVISCGEAYIVDAYEPRNWKHVKLMPVMGWGAIASRQMLLLWDFSRVIAFNGTGEIWKTPAISWDGITFVSADDDAATFDVWNAVTESHQEATVELKTGIVKGGASPHLQ